MKTVKETETAELSTVDDIAIGALLESIGMTQEGASPSGDASIPDDIPLIGNSADVAYQIRQVNELLEAVAQFKRQASDAAEFYIHRIEGLTERADMLKENCGRWLKMNGLKKLATHNGTIHFVKRSQVTMPDDTVLLKFIGEQDAAIQADLQTVKPNRTTLKQFISSSGKAPEGYLVQSVEGISIRKVG